MWNARLFSGAEPMLLVRQAEAIEVGLEAAVNVTLHLNEDIVERAWLTPAADTTAEWAVQACIGAFKQVVDLPQRDGLRVTGEHESARWSTEALHQSGVRERGQDLCHERCLQVAGLGNRPCVQLGLAIVIELSQSAEDRDRAIGVLSVHALKGS